ncbi:hypothetical protein K3495_g14987 [Podosphaera aphanis]|nr:hypothetical protein K3495_g14987 [Podosphaera aphanis]
MNFIFASTKDGAQEALAPYFTGENETTDFINSVQMVNHLIATYRSSTLQHDSMVKFQTLRQGLYEPFQDFRAHFISLASKAKVNPSARRDLLYEKMNRPLKLAVYSQLSRVPEFNALCQLADPVDKERNRLEKGKAPTKPDLHLHSSGLYNPQAPPSASHVDSPNQARGDTTSTLCFTCRKPGHRANACPMNKLSPPQTGLHVLTVDSDDDPPTEQDVAEYNEGMENGKS